MFINSDSVALSILIQLCTQKAASQHMAAFGIRWGLNVECQPKAHVLKARSPCGALGKWWKLSEPNWRSSDHGNVPLQGTVGPQCLFPFPCPDHEVNHFILLLHTPRNLNSKTMSQSNPFLFMGLSSQVFVKVMES